MTSVLIRKGRASGDGGAQEKPCEDTVTDCVHLPAKERGLRGNPTCRHLDLGLAASRMVRK